MTKIGDSFGKRPRWMARGLSYPEGTPTSSPLKWSDFSAGLVLPSRPGMVPDNATPDACDTRVNRGGAIVKAPGTVLLHNLSHPPVALFTHASLNRTTELLLVSPPWLGVMQVGAPTWINAGLPTYPGVWNGVVYGDRFLFSNGVDGVFARLPGESTAPEALLAPPARALWVLGDRVFLGGTYIGGQSEPMGIVWNSTEGDYRDWVGPGAGFEVLIADLGQGDGIVGGVAASFDVALVFCRHSLWVARRTGEDLRPATYDLRIRGQGCVLPYTIAAVPGGALFASDTGIEYFNGNDVVHASEAVDRDLLQYMNDDYIYSVSANYDPYRQEYKLCTPGGLWVCELSNRGRWRKQSPIYTAGAAFPEQVSGRVTIGQLTDLIGNYDNPISEWGGIQGADRYVYVNAGELVAEDAALGTYKGVEPQGWWATKAVESAVDDTVQVWHGVVLSYRGSGVVTLQVPDNNGNFVTIAANKTLPVNAQTRKIRVPFLTSGIAGQVKVVIVSGSLEINEISLLTSDMSERMESV